MGTLASSSGPMVNIGLQLPGDKPASTGLAAEFAVFGNDFTAADGYHGPTGQVQTIVQGPIDVFVQAVGGKSDLSFGIEHDQIGLIANGDDAFTSQAKQPGRPGAADVRTP